MREALMRLPYVCHRQTWRQTAPPFLVPVSELLEPLRLGEEAPAAHSRENVCQWTTLFEALSPLETYPSNRERATSTNYPLDEFQAMHLPFGLPVAPREGETRFHCLIILLESLSEALEFRYP